MAAGIATLEVLESELLIVRSKPSALRSQDSKMIFVPET